MPVDAAPMRSAGDVEKTVTDVLTDLRAKRIDGQVAEQIRDAADQRVKQSDADKRFHRALTPR